MTYLNLESHQTTGIIACDEVEDYFDGPCDHVAIVSLNSRETQCIDCLKIWNKESGFKSDFPEYDRF